MDQTGLIARIADTLESTPHVGGAFLGGSHGREEADEYSDVDVYAVVADGEHISAVLSQIADRVDEIAPILYSKVLPNARTINSITTAWHRFDITVIGPLEMAFIAGRHVKRLFDHLGIYQSLVDTPPPMREPLPEELQDIVNEFIRVLGLSTVVNGRNDVVVAQNGTNLLRDMLIQVMVLENGPQPRRGVLALQRSLTPSQVESLVKLPALSATWPSVLECTQAIAREFFPRARTLANQLGVVWPEKFESVTRKCLEDRLGLVL